MTYAVKTLLVLALVLAAATSVQAQAAGNWQEVHGVVQNVQGNQLTLKADDGRMVVVDMAQVSPGVRSAMHPNMGVTVSGFATPPDRFTARYITQDQAGARECAGQGSRRRGQPGGAAGATIREVPGVQGSRERGPEQPRR